MNIDLATLSLAELKALFSDLPKVIAQREKEEKVAARKALEEFAKDKGFTLDELLGSKETAAAKTRAPVAAKYRDPITGAEWSGRGRRPAAFVGKNLDDFKI